MSEHAHKPGRYFAAAFLLIFAVIFADQASKWFVLESMLRTKVTHPDFWTWFMKPEPLQYFIDQQEEYNTVTLAPWLDFKMVWNRGISFGMFDSDNPKMPVLFMCVSLFVSVGLFVWMAIARGRLLLVALPLVIGGAIGNVCDRIRFGAVADFVDFHVGDWHWPAFNLADASICIGAGLLVIHALLDKSAQKNEA
jgi:signal peptidase II